MASDVDGDAELEPEHVVGVEVTQGHQKSHGPCTVRQLVQHGTKFGTLVEVTSCMSIDCVEQCADHVAPYRDGVMGLHEVEGYNCQHHPRKSCHHSKQLIIVEKINEESVRTLQNICQVLRGRP